MSPGVRAVARGIRRTHDTHQSPHVGSVVQTIGALIVLAIFAGWVWTRS